MALPFGKGVLDKLYKLGADFYPVVDPTTEPFNDWGVNLRALALAMLLKN